MANRLKLSFHHPEYSDEELIDSISEILDANQTCAIASTGDGAHSHVNTAYFAYNDNLDLFWLSATDAQHSMNIKGNNSVAVAVWDRIDRWTLDVRGLQLSGNAKMLGPGIELVRATTAYYGRFKEIASAIKRPGELRKGIASMRLWAMRVESLKVWDSPRFGARTIALNNLMK